MQRVGDHNFNRFGVNAHSSHRFGLSVRSAPALTCRLPFSPGCVLRLRLLDFKAVIFTSHKLLSRLLAHHRRFKPGAASIGPRLRGSGTSYNGFSENVLVGRQNHWLPEDSMHALKVYVANEYRAVNPTAR